MNKATAITCVFVDIGGVLLTNGWDRLSRKRAAKHFELVLPEMEDRHHLTFDTSEMIKLVAQLKVTYGLKIAVVSNEARELNAYRIRTFKLNEFVDSFVSSCFVHVRKPDADIFRLALDIVQVPARQIVYIENTPMFVQIAEGLGIRSILHTDYRSTCAALASFGLHHDDRVIRDRG